MAKQTTPPSNTARHGVVAVWLHWVRTLYPGYFASVMATGIVSIALLLDGVHELSVILWGVGYAFLGYLVLVYLLRWILFPHRVREDATTPSKMFGYFTFIAGIDVLATRSALGNWTVEPAVLVLIAAGSWLFLLYWVFSSLLFTNTRPLQQSVNGAWLVAIVATQSLAITWDLVTQILPQQRPALQLLAYTFWAFGILLYIVFITFIVYRFFFHSVQPNDLTPPYWINMGAMAITTVAGTRLLSIAHPTAFMQTLQSVIEGLTLMMWAWGTWWIPLLIIIGIWKYVVRREPVAYHPALWSMVFPLGMYATAVQLLARIDGLGFIGAIGPLCTWVAFSAWVIVAAGWLWSTFRTLRRGVVAPPVTPHPAGHAQHPSATRTRGTEPQPVG